MDTQTNITSDHGRRRLQQRGIRMSVLQLVIANADVALHAGNGCESVRLSRTAAREMVESNNARPEDAARACRIAVLLGQRGIVTALHPSRGRRGRRYRRQDETRSTRIERPLR